MNTVSVIRQKGEFSKRVFEENKVRKIFRKNEHFLPSDMNTWVCVSGGKKCSFVRKIRRALFSWNTRFEIHPFALLQTYYSKSYSYQVYLRKNRWKIGNHLKVTTSFSLHGSVLLNIFFLYKWFLHGVEDIKNSFVAFKMLVFCVSLRLSSL